MRHSLKEHLLYLNSEQRILRGHGHYLVGTFKVAKGGQYPGPDAKTAWYNRNLRIFSNIQKLKMQADERILVIIGAGHVPILRHAIRSSPGYRLVEVSSVLGADCSGGVANGAG